MIKQVLFLILVLFYQVVEANVRIETFHGKEIAPYTEEIVQFCDKIYREYPYLYDGDDREYESYLESYAQLDEAIICLAFDGEKVVGMAAGLPFLQTRDLYKPILLEHGYDLSTLFYLGEFGLKPEYQGLGVEEALYQNIEDFAKKDFATLCFWQIDNPFQKQSGYLPKDSFWKKLKFTRHNDLHFLIYWTNINEDHESSHLATYWMKEM